MDPKNVADRVPSPLHRMIYDKYIAARTKPSRIVRSAAPNVRTAAPKHDRAARYFAQDISWSSIAIPGAGWQLLYGGHDLNRFPYPHYASMTPTLAFYGSMPPWYIRLWLRMPAAVGDRIGYSRIIMEFDQDRNRMVVKDPVAWFNAKGRVVDDKRTLRGLLREAVSGIRQKFDVMPMRFLKKVYPQLEVPTGLLTKAHPASPSGVTVLSWDELTKDLFGGRLRMEPGWKDFAAESSTSSSSPSSRRRNRSSSSEEASPPPASRRRVGSPASQQQKQQQHGGRAYPIQVGPRGGKHIVLPDGKKVYV